MISVKIIR